MPRTHFAAAIVALIPLVVCACGDAQEDGGRPEPRAREAPKAAATGDAARGARVFAEAGCGNCHALKAAGSTGTTGPNLDEHLAHERRGHAFDEIVAQVANGGRGMPAFRHRLSEEQIRDVAAFVLDATRRRHRGS